MSRGNDGEALFRNHDERRRFVRLVAELAGRFGTEVRAFVLMDNHYHYHYHHHLLLRCQGTNVSETLRWLQTAYAVGFKWAHRRRGHVFQGRFPSVLIRDAGALDRVARYLHLNPVRIGGLDLDKDAQRRARELGCEDLGAALVAYTEAPIRQGRLESPWEGLVAGTILAEPAEARALLSAAVRDGDGRDARTLAASPRERQAWREIVKAAERILGWKWEAMSERYGDWGRDGTMAVATRALGWGMADVVRAGGGLEYAAAAKEVRRFWKKAEQRTGMRHFAEALPSAMSKSP